MIDTIAGRIAKDHSEASSSKIAFYAFFFVSLQIVKNGLASIK